MWNLVGLSMAALVYLGVTTHPGHSRYAALVALKADSVNTVMLVKQSSQQASRELMHAECICENEGVALLNSRIPLDPMFTEHHNTCPNSKVQRVHQVYHRVT